MTYIALLVWERIHWVLFPVHGLMHGQFFSVLRLHNQRKTYGRPEVDKGVVLGATHADVNIYSMFITYG